MGKFFFFPQFIKNSSDEEKQLKNVRMLTFLDDFHDKV
jgi:hypothetical protein